MGEIFFRRILLVLFFVTCLVLFSFSVFAAHPLYPLFSSPETGFVFNNVSNSVSISDTAVYRTGYYSVNGTAWQNFSLVGSSYSSGSSWLTGVSTATLPNFGVGEHYVIVYGCTYNNSNSSWNCHGDKWQLMIVNNTVNNNGSIINNTGSSCNNTVCGADEYCFQGVCLLNVSGKTYFVATNGNDNNPGNFTHPFATWQKAVLVSLPGDITYIRGGVWQPTTHISGDLTPIGMLIDPVGYHQGASGTAEAPIRYYNYPGETPILDGSLVGPNANRWIGGIYVGVAQYIYFKGLTISNLHETPPDHNSATNHGKNYSEAYGIGSYGANMRYENMVVHDVDGRGFQHWSGAWTEADAQYAYDLCLQTPNAICTYEVPLFASDNTSWINCDAYNLFDRYSDIPGNNADGWKVQGYVGNYFYWEGCRAWNYSDDGFDPSGTGFRHFKNCWAMSTDKYKGINPNWSMEGNGFKMTGGKDNTVLVENCIAANCVGVGFVNNINVRFNENGFFPNLGVFYNNLAYKNAIGYSDMGNWSVYKNNIVYDSQYLGPTSEKLEVDASNSWHTGSNNTWIFNDPTFNNPGGSWPWFYYNPAYNVTDADFVSLDYWQLTLPRKADFSLPDITFGHLKVGSDLIDRGTPVGLPFNGAAPDLGPFETK